MNENQPTVQELAVFLRDVAYADEMAHCIDRSLLIKEPMDENGDVVYKGGLFTRNHVKIPIHYFRVSFEFTKTRGLYNIEAYKDGNVVLNESTMFFESFKDFVKSLFGVESLYHISESNRREKVRCAKKVPSLQELALFMEKTVSEQNTIHQPLQWIIYVVHPQDDNGDISYGGGVWTAVDAKSPFYSSLSFSYSKTCGIYGFQAWKNRCTIEAKERISFEKFQRALTKLFGLEM